MKTHEFKTEKGEFVVVDMKHNSYFQNTKLPDCYTTEKFIKLSEATEEDVKGVVENYKECVSKHKNYNYKKGDLYHFNTALESLHSLLTSKGIDINNGNWYLFKKI